jgi:NTP pyrophosphatase (non-canonical NTP hydrolase)
MGQSLRRHASTVVPQPTITGLDVPIPTLLGTRRASLSLRELSTWSRRQVARIARATHTDQSSELMVYAQAAKLVEEVGELHAEILGRSKRQRQGKDQIFDQGSLEAELADVVLATAVLAEVLRVNLAEAISSKMEIIEARIAIEMTAPD